MGFIGVHLGVGTYNNKNDYDEYKQLIDKAVTSAIHILRKGGTALVACTAAIKILEDDPLVNCGNGSNLTIDGTVECDASIMDGSNMYFGACGAVSGVKNPIELAYKLCINQAKESILVAPCILVGEGAYAFASNAGVSLIQNEKLISTKAYKVYKKYKKYLNEYNNHTKNCEELKVDKPSVRIVVNDDNSLSINSNKRKIDTIESPSKKLKDCKEEIDNLQIRHRLDTVGAVCIDNDGNLVSGVSSGGIILKQCGRIGQASILGAGVWADEHVAVCTTGCGEHIIKTNLAKEIATDLKDSNFNLVETLRLKYTESPILKNDTISKIAGAIVVCKSQNNEAKFCWSHTDKKMGVGYMSTNGDTPMICISTDPEDVQSTVIFY